MFFLVRYKPLTYILWPCQMDLMTEQAGQLGSELIGLNEAFENLCSTLDCTDMEGVLDRVQFLQDAKAAAEKKVGFTTVLVCFYLPLGGRGLHINALAS